MNNQAPKQKKLAALRAVEYIKNGMVLGFGTGSTTRYAIDKIGELINNGTLKNIVGIPSSKQTEELAKQLNIPLTTLENHPVIDLTIDGADEVDAYLNLIKGGGGALLREKILAQASKRLVVIVDETKLSPKLGMKWAIPIEVVEFGWKPAFNFLESMGAKVNIRKTKNSNIFKTDEGNIILDADFGPIENVAEMAGKLNQQAAIVENGLFVGLASEVIVAGIDGIRHLKK